MVYCELEGVAGYVKNEQKQDVNKKMEDGKKLFFSITNDTITF